MAKKTTVAAPAPGTSLNTAPRHPGITSKAQAEMEAKALAGPTENKGAKLPAKKAARKTVKKAAKKPKRR